MEKAKWIVAHRGASSCFRENTLEAFEKAIEIGADMVEFDVRKTRDNQLIAFHDETLCGKNINHLTLDEARSLAGHPIPTLEQILKLTAGRIRLDVELKEEGYETEILERILHHFSPEGFIVSSFHDESLRVVKSAFPRTTTGLLLGIDQPKPLFRTRLSELFPIRRGLSIHADLLIPHWKLLAPGFLRRAIKHRMPALVWTVNDRPMLARLLRNENVKGVITDVPDVAMSIRDEKR